MADDLTDRTVALTDAVEHLTVSVDAHATNLARTKKIVTATVVGLILDTLLTIAGIVLYANQRELNHRLVDANTQLEVVQDRTSNEVLCPLYALLLAFEPRVEQSAALSEQERAQRRAVYDVIHSGYKVLGCH